jgi:hypothetical protein
VVEGLEAIPAVMTIFVFVVRQADVCVVRALRVLVGGAGGPGPVPVAAAGVVGVLGLAHDCCFGLAGLVLV